MGIRSFEFYKIIIIILLWVQKIVINEIKLIKKNLNIINITLTRYTLLECPCHACVWHAYEVRAINIEVISLISWKLYTRYLILICELMNEFFTIIIWCPYKWPNKIYLFNNLPFHVSSLFSKWRIHCFDF